MKFKTYLETISGVEIYPMISLLVFVLFFIALIFFVARADNNYIKHMQQIPFDNKL